MYKENYPKNLYHYCSMEKATSILINKNFRLSDITKSNDVNEMSIFFPGLFDELITQYDKLKGFSSEFVYKGKSDKEAFWFLVSELKSRIEKELDDGSISTFVICLSEEADLLSQWRGYANDGRGISIGFDVDKLIQFVGVPAYTGFALEKVEYLSKEQISQWICDAASELLWVVNAILQAIEQGDIKYGSYKEFEEDIFYTLYYNILSYIEESIKFKSDGFVEEKEWRFFIKNSLNKEELEGKVYTSIGTLSKEAREKASKYVADNVQFNTKENDIVPYISMKFESFSENLISEVICGPNNTIRERDLEMFLRKYGYKDCTYRKSNITYIVR